MPMSRRFWRLMTYWWTPCAAGRRPGPAFGSISATFPKKLGRPRKNQTLITIRPSSGTPALFIVSQSGPDLYNNRAKLEGFQTYRSAKFPSSKGGLMSIDLDLIMREQLVQRRDRVATAITVSGPDPQLTSLLDEVDAALARFESGTYGLCEVCHDPVETDRLIANPLERFCLDHLNAAERRALEDDLKLAAEI